MGLAQARPNNNIASRDIIIFIIIKIIPSYVASLATRLFAYCMQAAVSQSIVCQLPTPVALYSYKHPDQCKNF